MTRRLPRGQSFIRSRTTGPNLITDYRREPRPDYAAKERLRDANRAIARIEREIAEAARRGELNPYADAEVPF